MLARARDTCPRTCKSATQRTPAHTNPSNCRRHWLDSTRSVSPVLLRRVPQVWSSGWGQLMPLSAQDIDHDVRAVFPITRSHKRMSRPGTGRPPSNQASSRPRNPSSSGQLDGRTGFPWRWSPVNAQNGALLPPPQCSTERIRYERPLSLAVRLQISSFGGRWSLRGVISVAEPPSDERTTAHSRAISHMLIRKGLLRLQGACPSPQPFAADTPLLPPTVDANANHLTALDYGVKAHQHDGTTALASPSVSPLY